MDETNRLLLAAFRRRSWLTLLHAPAGTTTSWRAILAFIAVLASVPASVDAAERMALAIAEFDFSDTSEEVTDQSREHAARLQLFGSTLQSVLSTNNSIEIVQLTCPAGECTGRTAGLKALSQRAKDAGARYLLIGEIKKMSTLVGQVKFAVLDLTTSKSVCDRFLSYRGDSDEAWRRAAVFAANDIPKKCLPE